LKSTERVLEIGTGSGYGAAILSHLAREVFTIETNEKLCLSAQQRLEELGYKNVFVRCGDGNWGWLEHAPYDGISVTAGAVAVPPALLEQLAPGGRLVIPIGPTSQNQRLLLITKSKDGSLNRQDLGGVAFVPFVGSEQWTHFS
jgi:protein-L-isoaspartate(D-aspartate) O-methyltransferase